MHWRKRIARGGHHLEKSRPACKCWRETFRRHAAAKVSLRTAAAFAAARRHPGWSARRGGRRGRGRGLRLRSFGLALLLRRRLLRGALLHGYLFLLLRGG